MRNYLGLMLDPSGVIRELRPIESQSDWEAIERLRAGLVAAPAYAAAEIWLGECRIGKVLRPLARVAVNAH